MLHICAVEQTMYETYGIIII